MHGTIDRDLGSTELWERSLEHSRRRRVLAEGARKEIARRKTASFALTAAVAATPMWPGVTAAADLSRNHVDKRARDLDNRHVQRILLTYGDRGSSVAELQRALRIPADGIFGPQTRWAVRSFQEQSDLRATGEVDVRTWLTLFPTDMIVYAPPGASSAMGVNHSTGPEWAAVSAPQSDAAQQGGSAQVAAANGSRSDAAADTKRHRKATAQVADLFGGGQGATQGEAPPAGVTPVPGAPSGGGAPGHGVAPVGPGPSPPSFHFPRNGTIGDMIAAMMSAARQIDRRHYAYRWGGGHNASFSGPYDCSGAVSAVLHAAGLLSSPRVSGGFMHWGAPGPGAVTIYANAGHVYMSILGHYFGTSSSNPGGGAGWFRGGPRPGFAVVHVPFSKLHLRRHRTHRRHRRHHATPSPGSTQPVSQPQPAPAPDVTVPKTAPPSWGDKTETQTGTQTGIQPVEQAPTTQRYAPAPTSQPVAGSQDSGSVVSTGSGQSQGQVTPTGESGPATEPTTQTVQSAPVTQQPESGTPPVQQTTSVDPPATGGEPTSDPPKAQTPSSGASGQQGGQAPASAPDPGKE